MINFWQLLDAIRSLDPHDYLFIRAKFDDDLYVFRIERTVEYHDYDEERTVYLVRMTKRGLPVAYLHTFGVHDNGSSGIAGFFQKFKEFEMLALEEKNQLNQILKEMV